MKQRELQLKRRERAADAIVYQLRRYRVVISIRRVARLRGYGDGRVPRSRLDPSGSDAVGEWSSR